MLMVEAVVELLVEKNLITGDEVIKTVKKLKEQATLEFGSVE